MAKKKKGGASFIVSIICLVLSVLLVATFFMPTFAEKTEDGYKYNGVVLTQAFFMDEDDAKEAGVNALNVVKYNEEEREDFARSVAAYTYLNNEENAGFKIAVVANWFVVIAGVAGIILSVLALLNKGNGLGLIIAALVGTVAGVALLICASSFANYIYDTALIKDLATLSVGAGTWIAMISAVVTTGAAVAGKVMKK